MDSSKFKIYEQYANKPGHQGPISVNKSMPNSPNGKIPLKDFIIKTPSYKKKLFDNQDLPNLQQKSFIRRKSFYDINYLKAAMMQQKLQSESNPKKELEN